MSFQDKNFEKPSASWSAATHYNAHAKPDASKNVALKKRANGPLYELKKFHNGIKRSLIHTYAAKKNMYLDLGCGRGGDIQKLCDAQVQTVVGIDISPLEIAEARRRVREARGCRTQFTYICADALSWIQPTPATYFDVVACMFCIHYFFENEASAKSIISKVSDFLKPGGIFIGCVPDACKIKEFHASNTLSPYLTLIPQWKDTSARPYGNPYIFNLRDTVTEKTSATHGSVEYLVHFDVLASLAMAHGMTLVDTGMFEPPDRMPGMEVSRLFRWFVFKKK